jgi:hypothetical protein
LACNKLLALAQNGQWALLYMVTLVISISGCCHDWVSGGGIKQWAATGESVHHAS